MKRLIRAMGGSSLAVVLMVSGCQKDGIRQPQTTPPEIPVISENTPPTTLPNGLPLYSYRLPNGLRLFVIRNPAAPVFTYQTWFAVGSAAERLDPAIARNGLAHLFEHLMFRGTTRVPDGSFDERLMRAGVHDENATTWLDRTNYYQSLPKEHLELVMDLESDRMVNLTLDASTLESERDAVLGEYRVGLDDPDSVAYDRLYETAFVSHPYRHSTIGSEADIRSFTLDDLRYFYRTYYAPNNAVILIAGDVIPDDVAAMAGRYYGAIAAQPIPATKAPPEPAQTLERVVEFQHAQLLNTRALIGFHVPEARHADSAALLVARGMLALGEGAMLNGAWIRAGVASTLSSELNQLKDPGLFIVGADLQSGRQPADLLGALDKALAHLERGEFSDADLERARNQVLLDGYRRWSDNAGLCDALGEFAVSAGDPAFAVDLLKAVESVTGADIRRVTAAWLKSSNRTVVIGRPEPARRVRGRRS